MISTSRFLTWASSCAMTPSSSAGESRFMIPVVAQTVALFCDLPIANAFGIAVWATAIFGFGRSAWMQRRSIIACSSGASCGVTSRAPIACSASLSEVKNCSAAKPAGDQQDHEALNAGREQHADERDVQRAEQEQREQHAGLKPGIARERRLRGSHGSILPNAVGGLGRLAARSGALLGSGAGFPCKHGNRRGTCRVERKLARKDP